MMSTNGPETPSPLCYACGGPGRPRRCFCLACDEKMRADAHARIKTADAEIVALDTQRAAAVRRRDEAVATLQKLNAPPSRTIPAGVSSTRPERAPAIGPATGTKTAPKPSTGNLTQDELDMLRRAGWRPKAGR